VCNGAETCQGGTCAAGTALSCNDSNVCTTDSCNAVTGCAYTPISGCQVCGANSDCDDGDPCTMDTCDPGTGCQSMAAPDATPCSDGVFCNGLETCRGSVCAAGGPPECDDANVCTMDACDEAASRCMHESITGCCTADADCADSDACTVNEHCEDGTCASDPVTCTAPGACTEATCDPAFGCGAEERPDGTACDDGDPCTQGEVCAAGSCALESGQTLFLKKFEFLKGRKRHRLFGRAIIRPAPEMDPTISGAVLELIDAAGASLYRAELPGAAFTRSGAGRVFEFTDGRGWETPARANGLKELIFERRGQRMVVLAKAATSDLADAVTASSLTWVIRSGDTCARVLRSNCSRVSRREIHCR